MTEKSLRNELLNVGAFVALTDRDGQLLDANPHALKLAKLRPGAVAGRHLADCGWFSAMPSAQQRLQDAIAQAAGGSPVRREIDIQTVDGRRTYEFTFVPRLDADDSVLEVIISGIDVSIREITATEKNLQFLNNLGEATRELLNPGKIMEVTARMLGQHLAASRAAYADVENDNNNFAIQHDYTDGCASTVGKYSLELFGPQAVAAMRGGEVLVIRDVDRELTPATGGEMFHAIGISAIICCPLIKYGNLVAMMAVHQVDARDWNESEIALVKNVVERSWATIERARAQLRLEQKERQFEDLFEFAPDAIIMVDNDGWISLVNQRTENLFGYSRPELIGKPIEMLVPEAERERHANLRESYTSDLVHKPFLNSNPKLLGRRKDGSEFPAEVSLSPMETDKGPMIAASVRDNTERNKLEAQLQQSLKMETIGQLAGGVAHDFNNLLTVINATSELLIDQLPAGDRMRTELGTILRAGEQAASLTRQLLALSRQQVLNPVIVDLNDILHDVEPLLQRLIGEDINVKFRPAPDAVTTRVDRTQIDQVLLNLALNSRDAMPEGGTLILETANVMLDEALVSNQTDLKAGPHVMLSVSDTGCGMDEATRRKIFEPFFTTKPQGKGTGLGLSTVYGIVQQSGGGTSVYSEPGKGTTIKVFLPRISLGKQKHSEKVDQVHRGTETILVIEDEQEIRQVAEIMLERRGYKVLSSDSGMAAIKLMKEFDGSIDLVLSDVVMPGSSGPETMRQIRAMQPDIKVLYMSGYAADLIARHGVDEDPRHFVTKPFTLAELSRAVRTTLDD
jgi:PAS domain S-box-containing protein